MSIEIPGISTETALNLYDNDVEVYKSILCCFISTMPAVLDKIRNVSSETLQDYKIKIHGLRSICESIGAEETRSTANRLEAMAKKGDLVGIATANGEFLEKTSVLVDDIRKWLGNQE